MANATIKKMADKVLDKISSAKEKNEKFACLSVSHLSLKNRSLLQVALIKFGLNTYIVYDEQHGSVRLYTKI